LVIDSKDPSLPVAEYIYGANRYRMLRTTCPDLAVRLLLQPETDVKRRWEFLKHAAARSFKPSGETPS
jgi:pyruvate-ferredoxin/flavodoxin oxidoreductase